ncbi:hypothetical protein MAR_029819 [Mya arenaria]|uniref:Uncharacterized protein n=2 Tax=Mya arenaria TaxID=6604 RepID=A0ABY7DKW5_MYAAR|nr:hypothetical protein MAR_029819 [Mya arenaria]
MFFEQHEHLDVELLFMLRRCRHLQDLSVLASISADTIIDIMNLQHQRLLALKSINLTISGLTDADWARIDAEKERLLATVGDFVYVGPSENDSSDSGSSTITLEDDGDAVHAVEAGDENIDAENAFAVQLNNIEIHIEDEDAIFGPLRNPYHDDDDNFLL